MDRTQGSRLGAYGIVCKLGEGSVGEVYEAVHEVSQQRVALKVLYAWCARDKRLIQEFLKTALDMRHLAQPGFVQVYDFGHEPENPPHLAMEYLEGETLTARLRRLGGPLSVPETLRLGRQMAALVAAAHQRKTICQPFHPKNVMIIRDQETPNQESIKLLDFQITKLASLVDRNRMGTVTYTPHAEPLVFGGSYRTATYLPPELCRGGSEMDDRCDVYSLGIMLYRMLAGKAPFHAQTLPELMAMHIYMAPPALAQPERGLPDPLVALVDRMLAKKRPERPSMAHVAHELERIEAQYGPSFVD